MKAIYTEPSCIIDSQFGIYIPQLFARKFLKEGWKVKNNNWSQDKTNILISGPKSDNNNNWDNYWEVWDELYEYLLTGPDNNLYYLYHNTDLFIIPSTYEWNDKVGWFKKREVTNE